MPNQVGGAKPPAGTPNWLVNCGGGNTYRIGNYYPDNESFVWYVCENGLFQPLVICKNEHFTKTDSGQT